MAEKRVTKKENFVRIEEILRGMGEDVLADVMVHEIELVSKKRAGETKAQKANKELVEVVFDILANAEKAMTATEILNVAKDNGVEGITSNQKVSALLKMLGDRVEKVIDGKKSTFKVAEVTDEVAE